MRIERSYGLLLTVATDPLPITLSALVRLIARHTPAAPKGDGLTDLVRVRNGNICYWPTDLIYLGPSSVSSSRCASKTP